MILLTAELRESCPLLYSQENWLIRLYTAILHA